MPLMLWYVDEFARVPNHPIQTSVKHEKCQLEVLVSSILVYNRGMLLNCIMFWGSLEYRIILFRRWSSTKSVCWKGWRAAWRAIIGDYYYSRCECLLPYSYGNVFIDAHQTEYDTRKQTSEFIQSHPLQKTTTP